MFSSDPYETQPTLAQSNYVYGQPRRKITMVDQSTETDSIMDFDYSEDESAGSPVGEITPEVVDSACQTDELVSPYQETDSANETEPEIESESGVMSEANQTALPAVENLTPDNQQIQPRVEQDLLSRFSSLCSEMKANSSTIRDLFHSLRDSTAESAQTYGKLLERIDKFNSIETLQTPTTSPDKVLSQVPSATQESLEVDGDNDTSVADAPTLIREQIGTFTLPAEYDPNDTKWTLKHREYKPGLVELLPQTGVFVSKKQLKRRTKESKDCRTLARLLFTEIFSKNALRVCSLTGGKAKAFSSVKISVRPGLDEHAKMVLLAFVEEHGTKHGWVTSNTEAVMSTIRTKINDIRAKHERNVKLKL